MTSKVRYRTQSTDPLTKSSSSLKYLFDVISLWEPARQPLLTSLRARLWTQVRRTTLHDWWEKSSYPSISNFKHTVYRKAETGKPIRVYRNYDLTVFRSRKNFSICNPSRCMPLKYKSHARTATSPPVRRTSSSHHIAHTQPFDWGARDLTWPLLLVEGSSDCNLRWCSSRCARGANTTRFRHLSWYTWTTSTDLTTSWPYQAAFCAIYSTKYFNGFCSLINLTSLLAVITWPNNLDLKDPNIFSFIARAKGFYDRNSSLRLLHWKSKHRTHIQGTTESARMDWQDSFYQRSSYITDAESHLAQIRCWVKEYTPEGSRTMISYNGIWRCTFIIVKLAFILVLSLEASFSYCAIFFRFSRPPTTTTGRVPNLGHWAHAAKILREFLRRCLQCPWRAT